MYAKLHNYIHAPRALERYCDARRHRAAKNCEKTPSEHVGPRLQLYRKRKRRDVKHVKMASVACEALLMAREIAIKHRYKNITHGEDHDWTMRVKEDLKTDVIITDKIYFYKYIANK